MKKIICIAAILTLTGCATGTSMGLPKLMGPADTVECIVTRSEGMVGEYECTVKGRYAMERPGIF